VFNDDDQRRIKLIKTNITYKSNREIEQINHLMLDYVHKQSWFKKLIESKGVLLYNSMTDPNILEHSKAYQIQEHELFIYVESPLYAQHLSLQSTQIMAYINRRLKGKIIKKCRFKTGPIARDIFPSHEERDFIKKVTLTSYETDQIDEILAGLGDQEIKEELRNLFISISKHRKREKLSE